MALTGMNQHGIEGMWLNKPKADWDVHERLANASGGLLTVANLASFSGAALTKVGVDEFVNGNFEDGIKHFLGGRGVDVVDGDISKLFGTISKTGAFVDAGLDGLTMLYVAKKLMDAGVIPREFGLALIAQQTSNIAFTGIGKVLGKEVDKGIHAKASYAAKCLTISTYCAAYMGKHYAYEPSMIDRYGDPSVELGAPAVAINLTRNAEQIHRIADQMAIGSVVSGTFVSVGYAKQALA